MCPFWGINPTELLTVVQGFPKSPSDASQETESRKGSYGLSRNTWIHRSLLSPISVQENIKKKNGLEIAWKD